MIAFEHVEALLVLRLGKQIQIGWMLLVVQVVVAVDLRFRTFEGEHSVGLVGMLKDPDQCALLPVELLDEPVELASIRPLFLLIVAVRFGRQPGVEETFQSDRTATARDKGIGVPHRSVASRRYVEVSDRNIIGYAFAKPVNTNDIKDQYVAS